MGRYHHFNLYGLIPDAFVGTLGGTTRDIDNTLTFPNAYLDSPHDLGRIVSGALYDLVWVSSGNTLDVFPSESPCPFADLNCSVQMGSQTKAQAYDNVLELVLLSFAKLEATPSAENVTFSGFSKLMLDSCDALATWCTRSSFTKILEARGLKTIHNWYIGTDTAAAPQNEHLAKFGDDPVARGIILPDTLGWIPFRPGGSSSFANDDQYVDPCEAIIVFPNVTNSSNLLGFDSAPTNIADSWSTTAEKFRGTPIYEIVYQIVSTPLGFSSFKHPTYQAYVEPWTGVAGADVKGIPYLAAGESIKELAEDEESRIFGIYNNIEFDSPQSSKSANSASNLYKLRTPIGWLFKAPSSGGDQMVLEFSVKYKSFDAHLLKEFSIFNDTDNGDIQTISQTLEVDNTSNSFCN